MELFELFQVHQYNVDILIFSCFGPLEIFGSGEKQYTTLTGAGVRVVTLSIKWHEHAQ